MICLALEFFISDTSFYKIIKCILGIFFLTNLIIPLNQIKFPKINTENKFEKFENPLDNKINSLVEKKIKEQISKFLSSNSIKFEKIIIYIDKNYKAKCEISFDKGVDNPQKIIKMLKEKFKIDFYLKKKLRK